jgi:UDPglucose 6-dehydrogenase
LKLTITGAGYVGLVTGACFAEMGNDVTCVDKDQRKIDALLAGEVPIYEPGLNELISSNVQAGRLHFTASIAEAATQAPIHFIAVGTPPFEDGSADLTHVLDVAREIGRHIDADCIVVNKSTVPVGTAERVKETISEQLALRGARLNVDVVSNPEFLKEGSAIGDFMRPERVIIGSDSNTAVEQLRLLYSPFIRNHERFLLMGARDAEMTKYTANAMLATRISFMNEIAHVCERLGVDVENVRHGIGSDSRIGSSFLYPGCGYGGFCFPKDMRALIHMAERCDLVPNLLLAVESRNQFQKLRLFEKIVEHYGENLAGRTIAVWGLSFKPGTDDLREAPSLVLINLLINAGARIRAFDPVAMDNARRALPVEWIDAGKLELVEDQYDALPQADALALVTEWKPFRNPDFDRLKALMATPLIFDGRNQYDPRYLQGLGFKYFGIGR